MGIFSHWCRCPCLCLRPKEDDIKTLDYSHHCLEDVPNNVFSHERTLEEIFLDANQIRDLPRALFHCEGLRRLSLSDNELQSIPSAISSLTKLEELNISKNHILQIPDSIKSCKCLMIVEASINPLGPRLPDGFTQLINLQELYLNDAFLEFLPANFGRLSRLQIVELRENHLKVLPKSMSRLVELRRLDIGQNNFHDFPEVIGSLHKLTELWADCNQIISIPSIIGNLKNLTYLDASYNKIEEVAAEISECVALTDLTLSSNNLIELPETIGNLTNLTILRVDENEIKCFPYSLGSLTSLEELVFNENEIETLPSNIGLLRNLQTLIGDCNKLIELPFSIGSCMQLRILSLADNELKVLPDEIGRLSSLKVLNLNSNSLKYLPFSLTKITNLQALWLSENQHKPLIQFQSEFDRESGQKVLTCFLLPQVQRQASHNSPKSLVSPNETANASNSLADKQVIKFQTDSSNLEIIDDDLEDRIPLHIRRTPTPYPKELKAHARHARNLALKQKDPNSSTSMSFDGLENSNNEMIIPANGDGPQMCSNDPKSSQFEIKEAKVSKAPKSPTNVRHSMNPEIAKRPTTLPVNCSVSNESPAKNERGVIDSNNIELVASKITELLKVEENQKNVDSSQRTSHERKASYKVAVTSSTMKSPVEKKIKSKATISKEDSERGYRSDLELYSNEKPSNDRIDGYSSDWELIVKSGSPKKTTKPLDISDKVLPKDCEPKSALIHRPYESNLSKESDSASSPTVPSKKLLENVSNTETDPKIGDSIMQPQSSAENQLVSNTSNEKKSQKQKPNPDLASGQSLVTNSNDMNTNCSIGSLYPSSGSERPTSVSSRLSSYSSATTTSQHSSVSPNDISATETHNQTPALPPKPLNYCPPTQESGIPTPTVSNSRSRPQTASSQFIIHKFSHDSYSQSKLPLIGQNSTTHSVVHNESIQIQSKWNANGINLIDDSNESVSSNSSNSLNINNHFSHTNRLLSSNSNAHVFPVIIVKNPGLGFSIECGQGFNSSTGLSSDASGIYVSNVVENGPASTALKVGDQILQIDGIDLQNATKEKANHIFQSTGNTISLMVSRDKS